MKRASHETANSPAASVGPSPRPVIATVRAYVPSHLQLHAYLPTSALAPRLGQILRLCRPEYEVQPGPRQRIKKKKETGKGGGKGSVHPSIPLPYIRSTSLSLFPLPVRDEQQQASREASRPGFPPGAVAGTVYLGRSACRSSASTRYVAPARPLSATRVALPVPAASSVVLASSISGTLPAAVGDDVPRTPMSCTRQTRPARSLARASRRRGPPKRWYPLPRTGHLRYAGGSPSPAAPGSARVPGTLPPPGARPLPGPPSAYSAAPGQVPPPPPSEEVHRRWPQNQHGKPASL
ncbi:hypothetical protein CDD83_5350 [Cordyceps sp. RAO-2017]|nr:hypothetical protein CDD83_5350 [Cordyceps sp. RAO-2017]